MFGIYRDPGIPAPETEAQELRRRFKFTCRQCGSEDVAVNIDIDEGGSELTGPGSTTLQVGCNACRKNDFYLSA